MVKDKSELEFLYLGDVWNALWGTKASRILGKTIAHAVAEADPVFKSKDFTFYKYKPSGSLLAFECVIKHENKENIFYSLFSSCEGIANELALTDMLGQGEDDIEGYVRLQKNDAAPMWMFNPLYRQQIDQLKVCMGSDNKKQAFRVAGIGWDIVKMPPRSIKMYEGEKDYDTAVKKFLKKNPDKSEKDFPSEELDASHMCMIAVTSCDDAYEFSSDIYAVKEFKYHGVKFYCLEIEVLRFSDEHSEEERGMRLNLYVNKESLGKYKPQIGDNISGLMQLQAYLDTK